MKYEYLSPQKPIPFYTLIFNILSFLPSYGQNCVIPRLVDGEEFSSFLSTYSPVAPSQTHAANVNWLWYVSAIDL